MSRGEKDGKKTYGGNNKRTLRISVVLLIVLAISSAILIYEAISLFGSGSSDFKSIFGSKELPHISLEKKGSAVSTSRAEGKTLDELFAGVRVKGPERTYYDRREYTEDRGARPYYTYRGMRFRSLRLYAYYASENYDGKKYTCPYDGGEYSLDGVEFDHIIPLHYVDQHGGAAWSVRRKRAFAKDPSVGVDVSAYQNRVKSDKGPAEWMPQNNAADYCYTWLVIAYEYDIAISPEDMAVIEKNLEGKTAEDLHTINEYRV